MKTCQNCKARSKDDMVECVHCGTLFDGPAGGKSKKGSTMFGLIGPDLQEELRKMKEEAEPEAEVKKTLFGIPAQKVEELLASETKDADAPKKTMAGFNVSGLFSDYEEKKDNESEKVSTLDAKKTMAGLQVADLFSDEESAKSKPKPVSFIDEPEVKKTMAGVNVADLFPEEEKTPEKEKKEDGPQFGTMMGISVADVMSYTENATKGSSKTLFSIPLSESPSVEKGEAPRRRLITGPKINGDTAAGGIPAATRNVNTHKPAKVSLGALIPKVSMEKKGIKAPSAEHKSVQEKNAKTPVNAESGIFRKPKRGSQENREKKNSGVIGSFVVGKSSSPTENENDFSMESFPGELPEESELLPINPTPEEQHLSDDLDSLPENIVQQLTPQVAEDVSPVVYDQLDSGPSAPVEIPKAPTQQSPLAEVEAPALETKPETPEEGYQGSISKVQYVFVTSGILIIIGANLTFFLKHLSSSLLNFSAGISVLCLFAAVFAMTRKEAKGTLLSISALFLFMIGAVGAALVTPLSLLFVFAGALFFLAALFPKIVSKL